MTRSTTDALVTAVRLYKEGADIKEETLELTVEKCDSRAKAEIALSKKYKNSLVRVDHIGFKRRTYKLEDSIFFEHAELLKEEELEESDLIKEEQ